MVLIKGGSVLGALAGTPDILIEDGRITKIAENINESYEMEVIDATGLIIAPGLVDIHVHLREPGHEYKEDIMSGAAAAAAGGITTCCCMANTDPVADSVEVIRYIENKAKTAPVRVIPYGAVTCGQKGEELTDFVALKVVGAAALSDDGNPVQSAGLMRRALELACEYGLLIISHCEDAELAWNFAVNEGKVSKQLGINGRPAIAEEIMVARDVMLAADTGAKLHIAHVSTAGSVDIIRKAKAAGVKVTAETCPHYFTLTEDEVIRQGAAARVNPPLRTANDVDAVINGLLDGTIDIIASDHAPHSPDEKNKPLADAPSGMIGLETSFALALTFLYHTGKLGLQKIIELMSGKPSALLQLSVGALSEGAAADIIAFDPDEEWVVYPELFKSKSRNTPFAGMKLRGKVKYTISRGEVVYKDLY